MSNEQYLLHVGPVTQGSIVLHQANGVVRVLRSVNATITTSPNLINKASKWQIVVYLKHFTQKVT